MCDASTAQKSLNSASVMELKQAAFDVWIAMRNALAQACLWNSTPLPMYASLVSLGQSVDVIGCIFHVMCGMSDPTMLLTVPSGAMSTCETWGERVSINNSQGPR